MDFEDRRDKAWWIWGIANAHKDSGVFVHHRSCMMREVKMRALWRHSSILLLAR